MSQLQRIPPFITDPFALKILLELGGKATTTTIKEHVHKTYDLTTFPHAIQYLMTQYNGLRRAGFVDSKKTKNELMLWIREDAKEVAQNMVSKYGTEATR